MTPEPYVKPYSPATKAVIYIVLTIVIVYGWYRLFEWIIDRYACQFC